MTQKIRVLLYCRLARDDSMVMECQKAYLRRWAAENGYTAVGEITEVGSGIQHDRPGLAEVMRAVQKKRMDALVVRKLDRLARRPLDAYWLIEQLKKKGVDLICTDEKLTPDLFVTRF
ncbi:MAG: recombinase family protein [Oscillibacter sp.]|nr:recombinase family protein [Oscillibacter sp.]